MDLLDWHRGTLTTRRLAVLVRHLPPESAFARAHEGERAEWTLTDHLLAAAVDHLAIGNWMFASVNRDEYADPLDPPEAVPRPGAGGAPTPGGTPARDSSTVRGPSGAELAQFFGA
ncbi:hypothetical protein AQ490_18490 [Wenjunlia vitaminophila]|uniref:Uncharacterized protein n=1 Tax=Wenjunlia vitaminophila TaxID=76728 RepID=A0A0T6LUI5_WENVI|nr:hypothetical protein [Wenjunlia vitaminophila]KRV49700.1 hypothetical protein AQ490_18490 [Wenjunlia vitaminophila]